jgi:hypothetical protein
MLRFRHLAIFVVVVGTGVTNFYFVNRSRGPIERADPPQESMELTDSVCEPIVFAEPPADAREAERSRRAVRPAGDPERKDRMTYDLVLEGRKGGTLPPKPAEPMPPTYCRSIERAPKNDSETNGPYRVHYVTLAWFENESGFGFRRMLIGTNDRGVQVASRVIDRVELVSLLTDDEPSVYVLDEMATPPLARQAKRRPLDEFERLGLNAVRFGEELVWTREAPTRMFGAIRAKMDCLECHAHAKEGDLLGAFTYYLNAPVNRLRGMRE